MLSSRNAYVYVVFTVPLCVWGGGAHTVTLATGQNSACGPACAHTCPHLCNSYSFGGRWGEDHGRDARKRPVIKRRF